STSLTRKVKSRRFSPATSHPNRPNSDRRSTKHSPRTELRSLKYRRGTKILFRVFVCRPSYLLFHCCVVNGEPGVNGQHGGTKQPLPPSARYTAIKNRSLKLRPRCAPLHLAPCTLHPAPSTLRRKHDLPFDLPRRHAR